MRIPGPGDPYNISEDPGPGGTHISEDPSPGGTHTSSGRLMAVDREFIDIRFDPNHWRQQKPTPTPPATSNKKKRPPNNKGQPHGLKTRSEAG